MTDHKGKLIMKGHEIIVIVYHIKDNVIVILSYHLSSEFSSSFTLLDMTLQFVKSQRGSDKLVHDGWLHTEYRRSDEGKIFYRCDCHKKTSGSCKRRVVVQNGTIKEVCFINPILITNCVLYRCSMFTIMPAIPHWLIE